MSQRIWTVEQLRFQEWLALPKRLREPKTQRELAKVIGVGEDTLSDWKRFDGFVDAVNVIARRYLKESMPAILDAIATKATKGDMPAAKLALQVTDMLQETINVNLNRADLKAMSDEELEQIANGGKS